LKGTENVISLTRCREVAREHGPRKGNDCRQRVCRKRRCQECQLWEFDSKRLFMDSLAEIEHWLPRAAASGFSGAP